MLIKTRENLVKYAAERGCKNTAEIGVYDGKFSEVICRNIPDCIHRCVDTWQPSRNHKNKRLLEKALIKTRQRLEPYNYHIYRMTSLEASCEIPDNLLDFIYIDASHEYEDVKLDLQCWYPKLIVGGIMAGHDYGEEYYQTRCVKAAVDEFAASVNATVSLTEKGEWSQSWYFIKE